MKSGLYKQMEEAKVEDCNKLTMEILTDFLTEISSKKEDTRELTMGTGKKGVIQYYERFYIKCGLNKDIIEERLKELQKTLPNGYYTITSKGVEGIDY